MTTCNNLKVIISSGEPAGIGPDICILAAQHHFDAALVVIACPKVLQSRAQSLGLKIEINIISCTQDSVPPHQSGRLNVIPVSTETDVYPGELNPVNSQYVIDCINIATDRCMTDEFQAMVTAPVHKGIINDSGIIFSGHTEWIAERTGNNHPVMMLADEHMRVCLATTHMPLHAVAASITELRLRQVLKIMDADLKRLYGLEKPKIAVCGLNPHAGENGYLGTEEIEIIEPEIKKLNAQGLNLTGPVPADTIFARTNLVHFDAVLAMYHDQGLPVIKHNNFGEVVNITLGIPIIRTSVDHGTALNLAGTGNARESSMVAAINMAIQFAKNQNP